MADEMERSGTGSFFSRFELTRRVEEMVMPYLADLGIESWEYGQNVLIGHNGSLEAYLKKLKAKLSPAALMVKFSPDFICHVVETDEMFFLDIKTSLTPVLFHSQIEIVRKHAGRSSLAREQIGLVEREAFDNYSTRYPPERTAICIGCPYHPEVLLAEWVSNIDVLFRFPDSINNNARGSKTPHTNIDLNTMRPLNQFLSDEFAVDIDDDEYQLLTDFVKTWPISNPGRPWKQYNACVRELQYTCPWLRQRIKDKWLEEPYASKKLF